MIILRTSPAVMDIQTPSIPKIFGSISTGSTMNYKFMFWFQLVGTLAGFGIPCAVLILIFQDISYMAFGAAIGIVLLPIMFLISMLMPQGRIYRKFAKWYRNRHSTIGELDVIFYENR